MIRYFFMLLAFLVMASGLALGQGEAGKKDPKGKDKNADKKPDKTQLVEAERKKFQGTWKVLRYDSPNERLSKLMVVEGRVEFAGQQMQTKTKNLKFAPRTFTLDPTLRPKTIDFVSGSKKELGIYEWEGEALRLAVGEPDQGRPAGFASHLIILQKD